MSVYSVEVHDLQAVLGNMAHTRDTILPNMSQATTRLERMKEYTNMLSSRAPPATARSVGTPLTARTMTARTTITRSSPLPIPSTKQAKSMTTEIYCGPCSRDNLHHEAMGFCIECSEYFCDDCIKHHKNLKITKSHVVRDRKKMPKIRHHIDTDDMEACEIHLGEMVRYYCKDHEEACCGICATLKHRPCEGLIYIPEVKAKKTNKNCVTMIKQLNQMITQYEKAKQDTRKNINIFDLQKKDFQQSILKVHKDMLDLLHRLEKEIIGGMNQVHEHETAFLSSRVETCDEAIKTLQQAASHLDMAKQNGVESKSFLQLKKVSKQATFYEGQLDDIRRKNQDLLKYKFVADDQIRQFIKTTKTLGELQVTNLSLRSITPLTQFDVKSRSDAYEVCDITGSVVLDDGRLILTDMYNESLKLVDSNYKLVTQTKLSAEPWDVCAINNDQVLVSIPREKKLQFFTIGASLRPLKKIGGSATTKSSQYYGVDFLDDKVYVTCPKDDVPNIKILDLQGQILKQLNSNHQEQNLFTDPLYIAVKHDGRKIYVSDSGNNMIISLELKSNNENKTYLVPDNNPPGGVVVQADGNSYFCGFKTNNILEMSGDCQSVAEVVGSEGGLLHPQSINYCRKERRLIVTMQKSDTVKVFQVT